MIIVFGSINIDLSLSVKTFPQRGETVMGGDYEMLSGGKGANQALAAARTGAKVAMVGRIGDDGMGLRVINSLRRAGVLTSGVALSEEHPTGLAVVLHDEEGESQIIVSPGANIETIADQVPDEILLPKNMLLMQTETPAQENWLLLERAKANGTTTILNLAPAIRIPQKALSNVDYLIVNETEAAQIAGILGLDADNDTLRLAGALAEKGNLNCIVTIGPGGSVAVTKDRETITVKAFEVETIVDRTGAGDAYCGTLAAALHMGKPLETAMAMASVAGSLACTKVGTQSAYAYLAEIEEALPNLPTPVKGSLA